MKVYGTKGGWNSRWHFEPEPFSGANYTAEITNLKEIPACKEHTLSDNATDRKVGENTYCTTCGRNLILTHTGIVWKETKNET